MKIIIINGSPRKNGITSKILHCIEEQLTQKDSTSVDYVDLIDLNIKVCKGCCACYHTGMCYIEDDAEKLVQMISESDGIVIGSPTYASNISGLLKVFVDRGHFVIEQALYGKYAMSVATGENYGSKDTSQVINKLLKYSGAKVSGRIVQNISFGEDLEGYKTIANKIKRETEKLYKGIQYKQRYIWQSFLHKIIFSIGIKPFVLKKGQAYSGVIDKWKNAKVI